MSFVNLADGPSQKATADGYVHRNSREGHLGQGRALSVCQKAALPCQYAGSHRVDKSLLLATVDPGERQQCA
jgi:hypothetical protein